MEGGKEAQVLSYQAAAPQHNTPRPQLHAHPAAGGRAQSHHCPRAYRYVACAAPPPPPLPALMWGEMPAGSASSAPQGDQAGRRKNDGSASSRNKGTASGFVGAAAPACWFCCCCWVSSCCCSASSTRPVFDGNVLAFASAVARDVLRVRG